MRASFAKVSVAIFFLNRLKWQEEDSCRIFCNGRGQEFILNAEENPMIIDWVTNLIRTHG